MYQCVADRPTDSVFLARDGRILDSVNVTLIQIAVFLIHTEKISISRKNLRKVNCKVPLLRQTIVSVS